MILQGNELKQLFRARLRARRNESGMSQKDLAAAIGVHQPYIAALENGDRNPTLETIAKLGEALEVPPEFFLSDKILSKSA